MDEAEQLEALRAELTIANQERAEIRKLIAGDPFSADANARKGVLGRLQTIEEALWGPEGRPNGIVGMVKEVRVTTRTGVVGAGVTVVGAVLLHFLGYGP